MGPPLISGGRALAAALEAAIINASMGPPLISGGRNFGGRDYPAAGKLQWGLR